MKNNRKKDIHLEGIKVFTTFCGIKNTPDNEDDLLLVEFDKSCSCLLYTSPSPRDH